MSVNCFLKLYDGAFAAKNSPNPHTHSTSRGCLLVCISDSGQYIITYEYNKSSPFPVAVRSKEMVCNRYTAGIAGSNPAGGMNIRLLSMLGVL